MSGAGSGFVLGDWARAELIRPTRGLIQLRKSLIELPAERRIITGFVRGQLYRPTKSGRMRLIWDDEGPNLVVDEGINYIFANDIEAASLFVGLKDTGSPAAGWTLASGPTEITPYSGNRPAFTENASTTDEAVSNSGSPASFSITGTDEVFGAFLATVNTGTGGTLIAAKDFASSVNVENGDTLNVTYTITGSSS